jgi:N-acetylmuramoyl-L-alanine amidase
LFKIRLIALVLAVWSLSGLADAQVSDADDPIARLLRGGASADKLPSVPAAPLPKAQTAGPALGAAPGQTVNATPGTTPTAAPAAPFAGAPAGPPPMVMSARIGEHEDSTRIVLELSDPVNLRAFTLTNPDRVVVDMPEVTWRLGAPPLPSTHGSVKSYRYGLFREGNSRMVIDLNRPVRVADPLVLPPSAGFGYRVVLDMYPAEQAKFDASAGWPADLKQRETAAEKLVMKLPVTSGGKKVIVIDPGHGGIDSGTNGVNGLMEKDMVLAEGLRLARVLTARGYTVHMTRDRDIFIPLPERVAIARKWKADLMISLHCDSNPDPTVNGLSIYTLNDGRSDREAAALARRENQSDVIAGVDLSGDNSPVAPILINLAQRDTINKSSRFAVTALERLASATDILARTPHRSASLAVLVAPDVPAVLIELGYLSNAADAAQMNKDSWRSGVAAAIADSVDRNFGNGREEAAAPAQPAKFP